MLQIQDYRNHVVRLEYSDVFDVSKGVTLVWGDIRIPGVEYQSARTLAKKLVAMSYQDVGGAVRYAVSRMIYRQCNS